jgi:hypothetical protein
MQVIQNAQDNWGENVKAMGVTSLTQQAAINTIVKESSDLQTCIDLILKW